MAKPGRHRRHGRHTHQGRHEGGGRVTPRGTPSPGGRRRHRGAPDHHDLGLLAAVRAALATGEPLDLLAEASSLVSAVDPRSRTPFERASADEDGRAALPSLDDLVQSLVEVERLETTALLACIAVLAPDDLIRARARRAAAGRAQVPASWLAGLGAARPGPAMEMVHVLGDGDDLMVEVRLPAADGGRSGRAHTLTVVTYVDHNMGTVVKDGFAVPGPVATLVELMKSHAETTVDTTWRDLDPADARVRITDAVEHGALVFPPLESDTWPACRPLVEWAARLLPPGGRGYERPEWGDREKQALTEAFFASPMAAHLSGPDPRGLFDSILWFATDYGPGDPLRWSPVAVEILLTGWIPRKIAAPASFLAGAPDVLRAFIAYAHGERGIRPALTAETLEAVDRYEPEYQRAIRSPRPQGRAALLAAIGAIDPDGPWDLPDWPEGPTDTETGDDPAETMLDILRRAVGGESALQALDDRPLPDEPFCWDGIDADVVPKVTEVLAACDRCCDEMLDAEYRTACRRFLGRLARTAPEVFRRRGRADTAAAAICWTIGKANELFSPWRGRMYVKDLLGFFDLAQGSVSQRAATFIRAIGIGPEHGYHSAWSVTVGDPELLVSGRRRRIMESRDYWRDRD